MYLSYSGIKKALKLVGLQGFYLRDDQATCLPGHKIS